jgi:glutamine synthetase
MVEMTKKEILPAVSEYSQLLSSTLLSKKSVSDALDCSYETETLAEISALTAEAYAQVKALEKVLANAKKADGAQKLSVYYKDKVLPVMEKLREAVDQLENLVSEDYWPMPTYGNLLFNI